MQQVIAKYDGILRCAGHTHSSHMARWFIVHRRAAPPPRRQFIQDDKGTVAIVAFGLPYRCSHPLFSRKVTIVLWPAVRTKTTLREAYRLRWTFTRNWQ
jgi:hypothetical protein